VPVPERFAYEPFQAGRTGERLSLTQAPGVEAIDVVSRESEGQKGPFGVVSLPGIH
jgi:hypothetical protein